MTRRPDLLARLEDAYLTPGRRLGVVHLLPAGIADRGRHRQQDSAAAPEAPTASAPAPQPEEAGALDTWYRVEDLWLRLGTVLPLVVRIDREQRCLYWLGLRRLIEPDCLLLRSHAVNLETYKWHEAGQRRCMVTLMDWAQDDLLLHLMPTHQLQRWSEGDVVDDLLRGHLARHATPWQLYESRADGQSAGATAWRSVPAPTG
jgi:hypothetical protein